MLQVSLHKPTHAIEPPGSKWAFPGTPPRPAKGAIHVKEEVVGIGADLEPGTLLAAYRSGVFPMPAGKGVIAWWAPNPRGIIVLDPPGSEHGLKVSRSLRKSCARFEIRVDSAFAEVLEACGDKSRPGAWIDGRMKQAYNRLHEWGWAHSVEAWDEYGRLAGGLYGVAIGGFFAGESMFHRQTDASKVALVALVSILREAKAGLLDVQWATPHLKSLGAIEVPRPYYRSVLADALELPQPEVFGGRAISQP